MMNPLIVIAIIAGFLIFFLMIWLGAIFLTSRLGGWSALAKHYGAATIPEGNGKAGVSLQMRRSRFFLSTYKGIVRLHFDQDALYLSVSGMFKPFHSPLRLPFDNMNVIAEGRRKWPIRLWDAVDITYVRESSIEISLRRKDYDWIMKAWQRLV